MMEENSMNKKKNVLTVLLVILGVLLTLNIGGVHAKSADPAIGAKQITTQINGQRIWQFDRYLSKDELEGRLAGTEGGYLAAEYISKKFREWGLEPAGDDGTYYQSFTFPLWNASTPVNLELVGGPTYDYTSDYTIFTYSGSVDTTAEVVFVGYGLTIPAFNPADYPGCTCPTTGYDDYAGLDVTDKIVLVLRHGPQQDYNWYYYCPNTVSPGWSVGGSYWFGYKSFNASLHGAKGMILVNEYNHGHPAGPGLGTLYDFHYAPDLGAVWADRSIGETLVPDLEARQATIDSTLTPASGPTGEFMNMVVTSSYDPESQTQNVLGAIPGTDPEIGDEVVIVSAHYDHLGVSPAGDIFPGADDGSGTAAMMEIAKVMASGNFAPKRTILFAAWGAAEQGLIGSEYYVNNPKYPLNDTVAVLQLDMVGMGDRSGVNVYGGTVLVDLFQQIEANAGEVLVSAQPLNPNINSDNAPFYNAGVPAVMIQTIGLHEYYHTPYDTIDTIDRYELEQAGRVVAATAYELAMDETFEVSRPAGFISRHTHKTE
jgi:hypothetical protein